jgi:hypothetical protein
MHWLRAHRVADGVDGKMGAPADALGRPADATVHRADWKALLADSI